MNEWRIKIDGWQPTPLNQLLNGHWAVAAKKKRADRDSVAIGCIQAGLPPATGKRRVSLQIVLGPRQRSCDPDAYWKSLLDALVWCKALVDDRRQCVELEPVRFGRGPVMGCVITLTDAPEERKAVA